MNHLKWMGHTDTLLDINRSLRDEAETCEVTLVARGGATVRAHRFVLCTCSDLLRNVLKDVPHETECTIMLPDITSSLLDSIVSFIYMGETTLSSASLSEFLEAINLLGIKSAISFECSSAANLNTSSVSNASMGGGVGINSATNIPIKAISGLQITQEEFVEDVESVEKMVEANNAVTEQQMTTTRGLEYLDVYSEQSKITYSIEPMAGGSGAGEFILTENANTYTITTPNQETVDKLSNATAGVVDSNDLVEDETEVVDDEEVDDANIIEEEYNSGTEPLLEMTGTDVEISDPVEIAQGQIDSSAEADAQMLEAARASIKYRKIKAKRQNEEQKLAIGPGSLITKLSRAKAKNPIEIDNLEMAAHAVVHEGLSLQKAADKFDLSKTVLWRRMRKDPTYQKTGRVKPGLTLAFERLKSGDSLKNISKDLEIPMSTLHRHKVRLSEEGRLPQFVTCRRRDTIPKDEIQEKLAKAVHACVHGGMSQNHAANVYEIPKSTLWRHLRRRVTEAENAIESENIKEEEVVLS